MMELEFGKDYIGGINGDKRTLISYGSSRQFVTWGPTEKRLPYGGFVQTRTTTTASFIRWVRLATQSEKV